MCCSYNGFSSPCFGVLALEEKIVCGFIAYFLLHQLVWSFCIFSGETVYTREARLHARWQRLFAQVRGAWTCYLTCMSNIIGRVARSFFKCYSHHHRATGTFSVADMANTAVASSLLDCYVQHCRNMQLRRCASRTNTTAANGIRLLRYATNGRLSLRGWGSSMLFRQSGIIHRGGFWKKMGHEIRTPIVARKSAGQNCFRLQEKSFWPVTIKTTRLVKLTSKSKNRCRVSLTWAQNKAIYMYPCTTRAHLFIGSKKSYIWKHFVVTRYWKLKWMFPLVATFLWVLNFTFIYIIFI